MDYRGREGLNVRCNIYTGEKRVKHKTYKEIRDD